MVAEVALEEVVCLASPSRLAGEDQVAEADSRSRRKEKADRRSN